MQHPHLWTSPSFFSHSHIDRKNTPAGPNKYEKANGVLHMRKGNGKKLMLVLAHTKGRGAYQTNHMLDLL